MAEKANLFGGGDKPMFSIFVQKQAMHRDKGGHYAACTLCISYSSTA
jgi:hypothetical protein